MTKGAKIFAAVISFPAVSGVLAGITAMSALAALIAGAM